MNKLADIFNIRRNKTVIFIAGICIVIIYGFITKRHLVTVSFATLNTPICKQANLDWTPCVNNGEWCVVCTGTTGPCEKGTEGVALPYLCESISGKLTWNLKNNMGECNGACKSGSVAIPKLTTPPSNRQDIQPPPDACIQNYLCDTRKSGQEQGCGGKCDATVNPGCSRGMCDPKINSGCGYGGCRYWEYCDLYQGHYACYWEQIPGYDENKACSDKSMASLNMCNSDDSVRFIPPITPIVTIPKIGFGKPTAIPPKVVIPTAVPTAQVSPDRINPNKPFVSSNNAVTFSWGSYRNADSYLLLVNGRNHPSFLESYSVSLDEVDPQVNWQVAAMDTVGNIIPQSVSTIRTEIIPD